jgi:histidyl-tRNA synthetase
VDVDLLGRGMGGQMKSANRSGAKATVIVGEQETATGTWTVKDMATGEQTQVADDGLEARIQELAAAAEAPSAPGGWG